MSKFTMTLLVVLTAVGSMAWQSSAGQMTPFPLSRTRLLDSEFKAGMLVNRKTLDDIGVERALYAFRYQAGLSTNGAKPLDGWARPEPGGAFPGFFEGHYLSAISLTYAQTGDAELLSRVNYMVAELGKCQKAQGGKYLFASPVVEFDPNRLDGVIWYRMHKLLEGLLAAYNCAGNQQALTIAKNLGGWIKTKQDEYTAKDEWRQVKRTEFGGMQEALENLYIATGDKVYRDMSRQWEEPDSMLTPLSSGRDVVGGHANTYLAKMVGCAKTAEFEKDTFHIDASKNFWDFVVGKGGRCYATGGTSVHEGFPGANGLADTQARFAQETCCSYNLLKVTRSLFLVTGDLKYMDYFERSLYNSILGSQDPASGWKTYYEPLNANTVKDFRSYITGCYCCNGTGIESFSKFGETIYSHDASAIYVNLFIASKVNWAEKKVSLEQTTSFPAEPKTRLTVHATKPVSFAIGIRIPGWCATGFAIKVNGKAQKVAATPTTYAVITRKWSEGDRIEVALPMPFTKMAMPNKINQVAFLYGPVVLVGVGARPYMSELVGDISDSKSWVNNLPAWFKPTQGQPLTFTGVDAANRSVTFRPYAAIGNAQFFTGYWDINPTPTRTDEGNVALGKVTYCSTPDPVGTNVEAFMRSAKAVDGNYGGNSDWYVKWFPNGMAPQWLTVDLGRPHAITAVEWIPATEDIRAGAICAYKIETSDDNTTWKVYGNDLANTDPLPSYHHSRNATTRYVKLTFVSQTGSNGREDRPKLAELKVFGSPVK